MNDHSTKRSLAPTASDRREFLEVIRRLSLRRGEFVLSSGAKSNYYLDLRLTSTDADGAALAARFLWDEADRLQIPIVGGPTLGADPIVGATVALSRGTSRPLRGFLVRKAAKQHGMGRQVEGHLGKGTRVIILDDVVTSAGSLIEAVEAVRAEGAEVVRAFCLVDRDGGGRERLAKIGLDLTAVFHVDEVLGNQTDDFVPPSTPKLTVDAILELIPGQVLLVERKYAPFGWALPGGFVEENESLEEAVRREVEEETGLRIERAVQMHTYSGADRDPRFSTASCVFAAVVHGDVHPGDDAAGARLFPLDALPDDLCFDHGRVLEDFRHRTYGIGPGELH